MKTFTINGKTPVHQQSDGTLTTTDVCFDHKYKPTPYQNTAHSKDSADTSSDVFYDGNPLCHKKSCFSKSSGSGPNGGVHSGTKNGKATFITASSDVFINSIPAVREGDLMVSNCQNTAPAPLQQPSASYTNHAPNLTNNQAPQADPHCFTISCSGIGEYQLPQMLEWQSIQGTSHQLALGLTSDLQQGILRQLSLGNLPDQPYQQSLLVDSMYGNPLRIPLQAHSQAVSEKTAAPKVAQEPDQFVAVNFRLDSGFNGQAPQPNADDFRTLMQYHPEVRGEFYPQIESYLQDNPKVTTYPAWISMLDEVGQSIAPAVADLNELDSLPENGWIYIFKAGFLWRELQTQQKLTTIPAYQEVDLARQAGLNKREPSSVLQYHVVLPHQLAGKSPQLQLFYTPFQLSWQRINDYGGMSVRDPRLQAARQFHPVSMPLQSAHTASASSLLSQRATSLDLSPWVKTAPSVNTMAVKSTPNSQQTPMCLVNEQGLPHVLLSDPIGDVLGVISDLSLALSELKDIMTKVQAHPQFHSALLSYQLFFNDQVAQQQHAIDQVSDSLQNASSHGIPTPAAGLAGAALADQIATRANPFTDTRSKLDQTKIETILQVKQRRAKRERIRILQATLIRLIQPHHTPLTINDYLISPQQSKLTNTKDISGDSPLIAGADLNTALVDLFSLAPIDAFNAQAYYGVAHQILAQAIGLTSIEPSLVDQSLNLPADIHRDAFLLGHAYWLSLTQSSHPLHHYLFPSVAQAQAMAPYRDSMDFRFELLSQPLAKPSKEHPFHLAAFASLFLQAHPAAVLDITHSSLSSLTHAQFSVNHLLKPALLKSSLTQWSNLLKATGNEVLLAMTLSQNIPEGHLPIGFQAQYLTPYIQHVTQTTVPFPNPKQGTMVSSYQQVGKQWKLAGQTHTAKAMPFAGIALEEAVAPISSAEQLAAGLVKAVEQVDRAQRWVVSLPKRMDDLQLAKQGTRFLTAVLLPLEVYHFGLATKAWAHSGFKFEKSSEFTQTLLASIYTLQMVAESWVQDDDSITKFFENNAGDLSNDYMNLVETAHSTLNPLQFAGVVVDGMTAWMAADQAYHAIQQGQFSTAGAAVLQSTGATVNALSLIGKSFEKAVQEAIEVGTLDELPAYVEFFYAFAPWGFASSLLMIATSLLVDYLKPTALESWATHSPFAQSPQTPTITQDQQLTYQLLNCLFQPKIEARIDHNQSPRVELVVQLDPMLFKPERDSIEIQWQANWQQVSNQTSMTPSLMPSAMTTQASAPQLLTAQPLSIQQQFNQQGQLITLTFNYDLNGLHQALKAHSSLPQAEALTSIQLQAQVTFTLQQHYQLPMQTSTENDDEKNNPAYYASNTVSSHAQ